jgi:hypothetical protein
MRACEWEQINYFQSRLNGVQLVQEKEDVRIWNIDRNEKFTVKSCSTQIDICLSLQTFRME